MIFRIKKTFQHPLYNNPVELHKSEERGLYNVYTFSEQLSSFWKRV